VINDHTLLLHLNYSLMHDVIKDEMQFDTNSLFGHDVELPVGVGGSGSLDLDTGSNISFALRIDFDTYDVSIEHAQIDLGALFNASGDVRIRFGPLSVSAAHMQAYLGEGGSHPALLTVRMADIHPADSRALVAVDSDSAAVASSDLFHVSLEGMGSFIAHLDLVESELCEVDLTIPSLIDFFENGPTQKTVEWIAPECNPNLFEALEKALLRSTFFYYLLNPDILALQLIQAVENVIDDFVGKLVARFVPLITGWLEHLISNPLRKMFGPAVMRQIVADVTNSTTELMKNHTLSKEELEQLSVDAMSYAICRWLKPVTCPPPPRVSNWTEVGGCECNVCEIV
jgi:hypothetical protein